jgi:hypothetical protein
MSGGKVHLMACTISGDKTSRFRAVLAAFRADVFKTLVSPEFLFASPFEGSMADFPVMAG